MRAANFARFFGLRADNLGAGEVRKVFSFCVPIYRWVIGVGSFRKRTIVGSWCPVFPPGKSC